MVEAHKVHSYQLWRDRRGRVSYLRIAALGLLLAPLALALQAWLSNQLAARMLNDLVHRAGYWALIFLLVTLAITPLRRTGRFSGLIDVRRLIQVPEGQLAPFDSKQIAPGLWYQLPPHPR